MEIGTAASTIRMLASAGLRSDEQLGPGAEPSD
jgi:hypothetical protein